ncbi:MAG TPA: hypothetical protein VGD58_12890 [Herpetosiphonaceae bacterium]
MSATQPSLQRRIIQATAKKQPLSPDELKKHMLATYYNLRWIMVAIAIPLPFLLIIGGIFLGVPIQGSMSAYYYTHPFLRDLFVGTLCAIGICLILYKGYSDQEEWVLNFAGLCSIGVALFPMEKECGNECQPITIHGLSAVLFFFLVAYVCIALANDTLSLIDEAKRGRYQVAYKVLGILMIVFPVGIYGVFAYNVFLYGQQAAEQIRTTPHYGILAAEAAAICIFGTYWFIKSIEIRTTDAENLALDAKLEQTGDEVRPAGGAVHDK